MSMLLITLFQGKKIEIICVLRHTHTHTHTVILVIGICVCEKEN